ncbi:hypothetical protein HP439_16070 [Sphingobacterium shayense]|uniref:hypothetical protein n=1 Tax=Sphingobacterium shayense TaxID=626343 RepID=UPI001551CE14|nr:hypothetical protein [Sphingobacterium shayense]NQD72242.1 hypothetical protein [Sphingobacterium shayense]
MNKYIKLVLLLLFIATLSFGLHSVILSNFGLNKFWQQTDYSLSGLYIFGFGVSFMLGALLHLTDYAMPKYISFVFLGCIFIKAIASYLYIKDGLGIFENDFLELNFLVTFFVFLIFDVFVAYQIVNQGIKVKDV